MKNKTLCEILRFLSLKPGTPRYSSSLATNNLGQLEAMYPDFIQEVKGKRIVDYGCGEGFQSLALARAGAEQVLGIDVHRPYIVSARVRAHDMDLDDCVKFVTQIEQEHLHKYDIVISHNSMEHFASPETVLSTLTDLLKPDGRIFITFGPPWYSMYGAHTNFFCLFPWIHLLFPESVVMEVRAAYTDDKALRYEEVRDGLNRMTRKRFFGLLELSNLEVIYCKEIYIAGMHWLRYMPLLRELCLYHISVILRPHLGKY